MSQTRTFLLIAWLVVGYFLWDAWQRDYAAVPVAAPAAETTALAGGDAVPTATDGVPDLVPAMEAAPAPAADAESAPVTVTTDVLALQFDASGGTLRRADLLQHRVAPEDESPPVTLMSTQPALFHVAQSGLADASGRPPSHEAAFASPRAAWTLGEGADTLEVPFVFTREDGLEVRRVYTFQRGSYAIGVRYEIRNAGQQEWQGKAYRQLVRVPPPTPSRSFFSSPEAFSFTGIAWYTPEEKFNKVAFEDLAEEPVAITSPGAWTAMLQHYFLAAWVPPAEVPTELSTAVVERSVPQRYRVRQLGPLLTVAPGATLVNESTLYVGPKLQDQLEATAPGLELSVDYGFLTLLSQPLFWLLKWLYALFGNWGWAIVGLVVIIKLAFFKLSETQFKSFAKMRRVQPRIEALKERYGDDRQKFQMAMMELYKKEKINPMGGCLPILVQIPVFIALYWVLVESVELRHAPWILWIDNLTARDPYFVLPALNMLAMWLTQKLSPAPGMDPMQKKMMQAMPFVFGVMFAFFPAGLVLYWATNGWLGLFQQWYIMKRHGEPVKV